jgi:hypothetical protein
MPCQLFGPLDPQDRDALETIRAWIRSCPSAGGDFPKACLNPNGTYTLYCCSSPGDNPCGTAAAVTVELAPKALQALVKEGELPIRQGGVIRLNRKKAKGGSPRK